MTVPTPYQQTWAPGFQAPPSTGSRTAKRVLSVVGGVLLTPVGFALLSYGSYRIQQHVMAYNQRFDALGSVLLVVGPLVLVGVVLLGLASGAGPIAGGALWGVLPGLFWIVAPLTAVRFWFDVLGSSVTMAASGWMNNALPYGLLLVGAGIVCSVVRRKR